MDDPIVEQVRAVRREIMAECGNDVEVFLDRLREIERKHKDRLVSRQPQPALVAKT